MVFTQSWSRAETVKAFPYAQRYRYSTSSDNELKVRRTQDRVSWPPGSARELFKQPLEARRASLSQPVDMVSNGA